MLTYIIRRLLIGAVTLGLITFLIYGLIRAVPGDPTVAQKGNEDPSSKDDKERIDKRRAEYHLDDDLHVAYWSWIKDVARGKLGWSYVQRMPIADAIRQRVGPTLMLSVTSLVLAYLLSIPLGLYSAARSGKPDERLMSTFFYMLYSLPVFVAALWLQICFSVKMRGTFLELPLSGMTSSGYESLTFFQQVWDRFRHLVLPVFCFTYGTLAYEIRFIRSNLHEVLRQDFIRTARAKGVSPRNVLLRHAFRNTLIPFITMIGLTLPGLFSGAVILEKIFAWPGVGRLMYESITYRDHYMLMGLVLLFSVLTLISQLLADILYAIFDPRITYD